MTVLTKTKCNRGMVWPARTGKPRKRFVARWCLGERKYFPTRRAAHDWLDQKAARVNQ